MQLKNTYDIRELKKKVHHLKPVVIIGTNGLNDAVLNEIEIALNAHEIIKIKIAGQDRDARNEIAHSICEKTGAILIQIIGNIAAIYRKCPT
jgi:RNA-binding protein